VRKTRGGVVEVRDLADFDRRTAMGVGSLTGWVLTGLDLRSARPC
jgi:hypothetical protein